MAHPSGLCFDDLLGAQVIAQSRSETPCESLLNLGYLYSSSGLARVFALDLMNIQDRSFPM
jgi:hypothetical protein